MTQPPSRRAGKDPRKLTTISYAVLGLLGIRPHSAYELAQQNSRSGIFWSAAQSVVYEEAKKLAAQDLATATTVTDGPRRRTVYAITEAGRRELHRWLSEPGGDPQVQYPDMLRVLFADAGTSDDLLAAIGSIRGWARRSRHNAQRIALDYLGGRAALPRPDSHRQAHDGLPDERGHRRRTLGRLGRSRGAHVERHGHASRSRP